MVDELDGSGMDALDDFEARCECLRVRGGASLPLEGLLSRGLLCLARVSCVCAIVTTACMERALDGFDVLVDGFDAVVDGFDAVVDGFDELEAAVVDGFGAAVEGLVDALMDALMDALDEELDEAPAETFGDASGEVLRSYTGESKKS